MKSAITKLMPLQAKKTRENGGTHRSPLFEKAKAICTKLKHNSTGASTKEALVSWIVVRMLWMKKKTMFSVTVASNVAQSRRDEVMRMALICVGVTCP